MEFHTIYNKIIEQIAAINPVAYAQTRNYTKGSVSMLSPYLSRGVITSRQVYSIIRTKYNAQQCETFVKELFWREYFQRLLQNNVSLSPTSSSTGFKYKEGMPDALLHAATGIIAIDHAISSLYTTGYMHNHVRMYTASVCNMAGYSYNLPAQWMYYHLLDGDVASNYFSWQWVYGLLNGKKYIANQDNINRFCGTVQKGTFLDYPYEVLQNIENIDELSQHSTINFTTLMPETKNIVIDNRPVLIYNSYNLDPKWHVNEDFNRVLLLEPSHFNTYPVSEKVINFILKLADNITGIQIYIGEYNDLKNKYPNRFIAKEHPVFQYKGAEIEPREWLAEEITEYFPSYSKYLKTIKKNDYEYFRF
ncbi:FAD-binding domain-containing protein [Flavobacterium beibuense]|uniref:FAD-binding domain-containing protein n=1 Tax=Flavobacterium beibuense TaxID=657326 RepID=UPI003A94359C